MCRFRHPQTQCENGHLFTVEYNKIRCLEAILGHECEDIQQRPPTPAKEVLCPECWVTFAQRSTQEQIEAAVKKYTQARREIWRDLCEEAKLMEQFRDRKLRLSKAEFVECLEERNDFALTIITAMRAAGLIAK